MQHLVCLPTFHKQYRSNWLCDRGIINSFGVFQTYYAADLLSNISNSDISWIGSTQAFIVLILGAFTGPLFDAGYIYHMIWAGIFLIVFGMMMLSLCTFYWQIMLVQGICVGMGAGLLLVPSSAIIPLYFSTRKGIAQGISAAGSSIGAVIYPIMFNRLLPELGFPWATRIWGFVMLATLMVSVALIRKRDQHNTSTTRRKLVDLAAFRELPYTFFCIAMFFGFAGVYVPFFYVPSYINAIDPSATSLAFYFIAIMSAASTFGRILPNILGDMFGCLNIMPPCIAAAMILAWCWIADRNTAGIIVWAVLYGFFTGCFVSMPPPIVVSLSPSLDGIGARMGMVFSIGGLGILIGNPVAGAILGSSSGYLGLQMFCGACLTAAAVFAAATRVAKVGWKLRVKA